MTNHVPTLETCQKLKEAGFGQEMILSHWLLRDGTYQVWSQSEADSYLDEQSNRGGSVSWLCAAPILTEILEQLPYTLADHPASPTIVMRRYPSDWGISYETKSGMQFHEGDSRHPAEAAALLWLSLKEQVV